MSNNFSIKRTSNCAGICEHSGFKEFISIFLVVSVNFSSLDDHFPKLDFVSYFEPVPKPITAQGNLGYSDHSGSIPVQGHLGHSDHVHHSLELCPRTLQHHKEEHGQTVH